MAQLPLGNALMLFTSVKIEFSEFIGFLVRQTKLCQIIYRCSVSAAGHLLQRLGWCLFRRVCAQSPLRRPSVDKTTHLCTERSWLITFLPWPSPWPLLAIKPSSLSPKFSHDRQYIPLLPADTLRNVPLLDTTRHIFPLVVCAAEGVSWWRSGPSSHSCCSLVLRTHH